MSDKARRPAGYRVPAPPIKRRRWVGFVGGLVLGAGLALLLITYSKIAVGTWPPVIIVAVAALAGTVWSRWGPVRTVGTEPAVGSPEADRRVQAAMRSNLEAIRRGELSVAEHGEQPVGPPAAVRSGAQPPETESPEAQPPEAQPPETESPVARESEPAAPIDQPAPDLPPRRGTPTDAGPGRPPPDDAPSA